MAEKDKPKVSYEEKIFRKYIDFLNKNEKELEEKGNWNIVFKVLNKLHIHPDYVLDNYVRQKYLTSNTLMLFARHKSYPSFMECKEKEYEHFGFLDTRAMREDEGPFYPPFIPASQVIILCNEREAVWQAFLLQNTFRFFGIVRPYLVEKRTFILNREDLKSIELGKNALRYKKIKETILSLPKYSYQVKDDSNVDLLDYPKFYLEYCYWSDYRGLVKEKAQVKYNLFTCTVTFETAKEEVLYSPTKGVLI